MLQVCAGCGQAGAAGDEQAVLEKDDDAKIKLKLAELESKQAALATQARCT